MPKQGENRRNWLVAYRAAAGLNQDEVADMAGIGRAAYATYEIGTRRPRPEAAQKIAKVLGFEWTEFFDERKGA